MTCAIYLSAPSFIHCRCHQLRRRLGLGGAHALFEQPTILVFKRLKAMMHAKEPLADVAESAVWAPGLGYGCCGCLETMFRCWWNALRIEQTVLERGRTHTEPMRCSRCQLWPQTIVGHGRRLHRNSVDDLFLFLL
jgi:hypothetical protein